MLELLMTRAGDEKRLRDCFLENLHYLIFDELHTYRGMQGSDVSFLIRRIRYKLKSQCYVLEHLPQWLQMIDLAIKNSVKRLQKLLLAFLAAPMILIKL